MLRPSNPTAGNFFSGKRGLLSNYPLGVVAVVNGEPVTKTDLLRAKQKRQRRILAIKRLDEGPVVKPCFVWTFHNDGFVYGGWWLYIRTLKRSWTTSRRGLNNHFVLKIMRLFPCGHLPLMENFTSWKAAFADTYHYPTRRRPQRQGLAIARATIARNGVLLDVTRDRRDAIHGADCQERAGE